MWWRRDWSILNGVYFPLDIRCLLHWITAIFVISVEVSITFRSVSLGMVFVPRQSGSLEFIRLLPANSVTRQSSDRDRNLIDRLYLKPIDILYKNGPAESYHIIINFVISSDGRRIILNSSKLRTAYIDKNRRDPRFTYSRPYHDKVVGMPRITINPPLISPFHRAHFNLCSTIPTT